MLVDIKWEAGYTHLSFQLSVRFYFQMGYVLERFIKTELMKLLGKNSPPNQWQKLQP